MTPGRSYGKVDQAALASGATPAPVTLDGALLDTDFQLLLFALQATTGCDPLLNSEVGDDAYRLYSAGYTADHVERFVREVWPQCWPGNKGERPTLKALMKQIGFVRSESDVPTDGSRYLADPYFADKKEERPPVAELCPRCGLAACVCTPIPAYFNDMWLAMMGQLQIQLKRSTYETWLRDAQLVAYADGVFRLKVSHTYAKEWLERHLLPSMREALNKLLVSFRKRQDGEKEFEIEIFVEQEQDHAYPDRNS